MSKSKSKIVAAAGASANASPLNPGGKELARRIEAAMSQAITDAYAEGISDPDIHKERMMAARERVKQEVAAEAEASQATKN